MSDACDAVGTGLLITGVGAAVGLAMYKVGTVTGSISEAISIGVDLYEGKYKNALVRGLNGFVASKFWKIINSGYDKSDMFLQKALDKMTDSFTSLLIE